MTPVTEVYDMAMLVIQDYQLDNLAKADYNAFLTYLEGKLMVGIPEIEAHMHDLELVHQENEQEDGTVQVETYFTRDLSNIEKAIISKAIVYKWYQQIHQDRVVIQPHLTIKEFKVVSPVDSKVFVVIFAPTVKSLFIVAFSVTVIELGLFLAIFSHSIK